MSLLEPMIVRKFYNMTLPLSQMPMIKNCFNSNKSLCVVFSTTVFLVTWAKAWSENTCIT